MAVGASGADLRMTVHPASNAGATLKAAAEAGAFHGMMQPTTPTGSRTRNADFAPIDGVWRSTNSNSSAIAA